MSGPPHAVLPVRDLTEGKSRLRAVLAPSERWAFNRWLLERMLDALAAYPGPARTAVATGSREAKALAHQRGMATIDDPGLGLNGAVARGFEVLRGRKVEAAFVVPVDLPFATAQSLRLLVESAWAAPVCLVAPDRCGQGTNFLYQSPLRLAEFSYGEGSFERHCAAAAAAGLKVQISRDERCAFDVDTPADFAEWRRLCEENSGAEAAPPPLGDRRRDVEHRIPYQTL